MACDQKTLVLISSYADGEACAEEARQAMLHLDSCPECRKMVREWQEQRQLLEWAYTLELPEEIRLDTEARPMSTVVRAGRRSVGFGRRWKWAGALAAAVVAAFVLMRMVMPPPMLGDRLATAGVSQTVRVAGEIELKVGPNSKITRVGEHSIRLDEGWVAASVRHGTGFEVLTRRVRVVDTGTEFQVGTAPKGDVVTVEEGSVDVYQGGRTLRVKAGQVLVARDGEKAVAMAFPAPQGGTESGTKLSERDYSFQPTEAEGLSWDEGLRALSVRFPDAQVDGSSGFGTAYNDGRIAYLGRSMSPGFRAGLQAHYAEIMQAALGGRTSGEWEVPVGFVRVDGIVEPTNLPADMYFIRLVSHNGKLVWRLSGAKGGDNDLPFALSRPEPLCGRSGSFTESGSSEWWSGSIKDSGSWVMLRLLDWPGERKPALRFAIKCVTVTERNADKAAVVANVARQTAGVKDLNIERSTQYLSGDLFYLDPQRKHRIFVAWNENISQQLIRAHELNGRGQAGSALMGVLWTDGPLKEPSVGSGTYLLWLVRPDSSTTPYWAISSPDTSDRVRLAGAPGIREGSGGSWSLGDIPGYGQVSVGCSYEAERDPSTYAFRMVLCAQDKPKLDLGEGWIRVSKP